MKTLISSTFTKLVNDALIYCDGNDDRASGDNFAPKASGNGGDDIIVGCERTTGDNLAVVGLSSGNGGTTRSGAAAAARPTTTR